MVSSRLLQRLYFSLRSSRPPRVVAANPKSSPPSGGRMVSQYCRAPHPIGWVTPVVQMFAAAALLGDVVSHGCHLVPGTLPVASYWAISSRRRNRLLHALHGNGPDPGGGVAAWKTVGGVEQDARRLQ